MQHATCNMQQATCRCSRRRRAVVRACSRTCASPACSQPRAAPCWRCERAARRSKWPTPIPPQRYFVHRGQPAAREQHESRRDRVLVPRLRVALIRLRTGPQVCPLVRLRWRHRAHGGGVPLLPLCSLFFCAYARVLCDPCGPGEITEPAGKRRRMCMHAPHLSLLASPFPAYDSCTGLRTTEHLKPSI